MAKDWAEECAERWNGNLSLNSHQAIEGAIREALEKAAGVAAKPHWDSVESIVDAIRALGAK